MFIRTFFTFALCWIALLLVGCTMTNPPRPRTGSNAVVFVGGYKGSLLRRADTRSIVWIDAYQALLGRSRLALDHPGLELQAGPQMFADGPLRSVAVIPGLFEVDAYQRTLRALDQAAGKNADVIPFSYDWRQSNVTTAQQLTTFIQKLRADGYRKIVVVGHSMGGLVTTYVLRYGAQPLANRTENWEGARLVDGVVLSGVPFRGALTILRDMHLGIQQGLNTTLLSAEAVSSFPSSWELLPHPDDNPIVTPELVSGEKVVFDPLFWELHGWGLLQPEIPGSPKAREARYAFIKEQLQRARAFIEAINAPQGSSSPPRIPCLNLIGSGTDSLAQAVYTPGVRWLAFTPTEIRRYFPNAPRRAGLADGDGTVTTKSAQLPEALRAGLDCQSITVEATHGAVTFAPDAKDSIARLLAELFSPRS